MGTISRGRSIMTLSIGLVITFIALSLHSGYMSRLIQLKILSSNVASSFNERPALFHLRNCSHAHNDDDSVAQKLREQVRVLVAVITAPKNLQHRAQAIKNTWAKHCNKILYFSTEENNTFPTIGLNVTEGYDHLTAKTMASFNYIYENYFNDFDWFMKVDDDTYVIMENLRYFLSEQNASKPVYFGQHFVAYVKQGYNSGGAGYVLSKESLRRFRHRGINSKCTQDGGSEDVAMGRCLESLGVRNANSTDSLGRSRFHPFLPHHHLTGNYPPWFYHYVASGAKKGIESMSDYIISFHYVNPQLMQELEFYVYHLRPYGIYNGEQNLNIKNNTNSHN